MSSTPTLQLVALFVRKRGHYEGSESFVHRRNYFVRGSILYCTIGIGKGEEGQSLSTKVALPGVTGGALTFLAKLVAGRWSTVVGKIASHLAHC